MPCKRSTILWKPKVLEKHTHVIYENIGSWETSLLNCCMHHCSIVHALTLFITTGRFTGWKNVIAVFEVVFMVKIIIGLRNINITNPAKSEVDNINVSLCLVIFSCSHCMCYFFLSDILYLKQPRFKFWIPEKMSNQIWNDAKLTLKKFNHFFFNRY